MHRQEIVNEDFIKLYFPNNNVDRLKEMIRQKYSALTIKIFLEHFGGKQKINNIYLNLIKDNNLEAEIDGKSLRCISLIEDYLNQKGIKKINIDDCKRYVNKKLIEDNLEFLYQTTNLPSVSNNNRTNFSFTKWCSNTWSSVSQTTSNVWNSITDFFSGLKKINCCKPNTNLDIKTQMVIK